MRNNLSNTQLSIWLDQKISPSSPKYNIGGYAIIEGSLCKKLFEESINELVRRNDVFSYNFLEKDGVPFFQELNSEIETDNLSYLRMNVDDVSLAIENLTNDFRNPFDVQGNKLFKFILIEVNPNLFIWYTKLHHLIADGYSFHLIFEKVKQYYLSLSKEEQLNSEGHLNGFRTYIVNEHSFKSTPTYKDDKEFWINKYNEYPQLIFNNVKPNNAHFSIEGFLSKEEAEKLNTFCTKAGVSVLHTFIAIFSLLLSKFYHSNELNIVTPILNRKNKAEKGVIGPFMNILPMQIGVHADLTFQDLINSIKREFVSNYRHHKFQYTEILKALSYDASKLYDVRISLENFDYQEDTFLGYPTNICALANDDEDDTLSIHIFGSNDGGFKIRFDVNSNELIDATEIQQLIQSFRYLVGSINDIKDKNVLHINILNDDQRKELYAISRGLTVQREGNTFMDEWYISCHKFKHNKALSYGSVVYTYEQLDQCANKLAIELTSKGAKKADKIGVLLARSEKNIIAILGIMKIGAVYVPIDTGLSDARKNSIIEDSQIAFLISNDSANYTVKEVVDIEDILRSSGNETPEFKQVNIESDDIAYIIYTSGTTGKPKGVVIEHSSLLDYIKTFSSFFSLDSHDSILQHASFSFDTSIEEIFPILTVGGELVISRIPNDFHSLLKECQENKISILSTNPFLIQYLNENWDSYRLSLRILISGGDTLKAHHIKNLLGKILLVNSYGPTESTVCATYHFVEPTDDPVPIGKPIINRSVYIVNGNQIVPKGAIGEIVLGGKGLAREYLNNPKLTDERFAIINGELTYRTGDIGKWDNNGNLLFFGRNDRQLNFLGIRIEAGEIENAIRSVSEDIKDCVVTISYNEKIPFLIAYLVVGNVNSEQSNLRELLLPKLSNSLIPRHFVYLKEMPRLYNGKVDITRLPVPPNNKAFDEKRSLASNEMELKISGIWEKLLNINGVDIHTSFFLLGGHSLLANQYISIIRESEGKEVTLKEFYEHSTIYEQSKLLSDYSPARQLINIAPAPNQEFYPLSFSQERIWFLNQLNDENNAYFVPRVIRIKGDLDLDLIFKTLNQIIWKHEILRTVFPTVDGVAVQLILDQKDLEVRHYSLEGTVLNEQSEKIKEIVEKEVNTKFNIEQGPLLRVSVIRINPTEHILILCEHHLIHDGWTQGVLLKEFINTYKRISDDPSFVIDEADIQFKDYAYWQRQHFDEDVTKEHLDFWKKKLSGHLSVLPIPTTRERPKSISGNGEVLTHIIDEHFANKLRRFSAENDATLFITMLTSFMVVLSRYSNETDICVGTGIANRRIAAIENMLGMVINTIPLRSRFRSSNTLQEILQIVKDDCFEFYGYEDTPFGKIVEGIEPIRSLSLMPLFQYMFSFMNTPTQGLSLPDLELEVIDFHNQTAKFDINVVVVTPFEQEGERGDQGIIIEWEYNTDIFSHEFMAQMLESYLIILKTLIDNPNVNLLEIDFLPQEETKKLLYTFNDTKTITQSNLTLSQLFEEQVKKTPDKTAIITENSCISYSEVNNLSNKMARYLRFNYNIKQDDLIGIKLEKSEKLIISILAILKAGAGYVPLDPLFTAERIEYIAIDTQYKVLIDEKEYDRVEILSQTFSEDDLSSEIAPRSLACVLYTSGSTGTPKGVPLENIGIVRLVKPCLYFPFNENTVQLSTSAIAFDSTLFEFFGALLNGGSLVLIHRDYLLDPLHFEKVVKRNQVNSLLLTSFWFNQIVEENIGILENIKNLIVVGDVLSPLHVEIVQAYSKEIKIYNGYGPTENSTFSTVFKLENTKYSNIPVGRPVPSTYAYVLNDSLKPVPIGVPGTIFVSGDGISRGYLNKPELTKTKFITNPFVKGKMMFNTGDIGKWLSDGTIEFCGRYDRQAKIRGFRIELDGIEAEINKLTADIKQAIVELKAINGEKSIVLYYIPNSRITKSQLKNILAMRMPDYMVPRYYVEMTEFPLTNSRKVNRLALPEVSQEDLIINDLFVPASNDIERRLVEVWSDILGTDRIGVQDNFFELGGHSLKVSQFINKINSRYSNKLRVKDVFLTPTIKELAKKIDQNLVTNSIPNSPLRDRYPLTSSQKRIWFLSQFPGGKSAYNIPGVFRLKGNLDISKLENAVNVIVNRHESLRTYFKEDVSSGEVFQHILEQTTKNNLVRIKIFNEDDFINSDQVINDFYLQEFDLATAPLLKIWLMKEGPTDFIALFLIHHIIGDGWSMEVLKREVTLVYNQLIAGEKSILPELSIQYRDYTVWKEETYENDSYKRQEQFWQNVFATPPTILELPSFGTRPKIKTFGGSTIMYSFNSEIGVMLKSFSEDRKVTPFMTIMAALNGLLYRYSGLRDITIGTAVSGRDRLEFENQIGLYINTLAIRTRFHEAFSFIDLLEIEKSTLVDAYENQDYPFDRLVDRVSVVRDPSRSPLFDILVIFQSQQDLNINDQVAFQGLQVSEYDEINRQVSQFDISFSFSFRDSELKLRLEYNNDIYSQEILTDFLSNLEYYLKSVIANPHQNLEHVEFMSSTSLDKILNTFNHRETNFINNSTIIDLLSRQIEVSHNAVALIFEDRTYTYAMLDTLTNQFANYLVDHCDVKPGDVVGLELPRNEWLILSLIAVLKTGAAYVPIDPSFPANRVEFIRSDCGLSFTIDEGTLNRFKIGKFSSRPLSVVIDPNQLSYVIYTSGSSGKPKGVMVEHRNVVALLNWGLHEYRDTEFDIVYSTTSYSFDIFVFESLFPLCFGKKVRILGSILEYYRWSPLDKNILLNTVPSVIKMMVEGNESFDNVSAINISGEPFPLYLSEKLPLQNVEVRNLYGPSETTVFSTSFRLEEKQKAIVPIGKPIAGTNIYILSDSLTLQPIGVVGELCISGQGVGRGYINLNELNSEKFIRNPFIDDEKIYRTGDLARWLPSGDLDFIGRKDFQVKIRGHRIELEEIEHVFIQHNCVAQAVVEVSYLGNNERLIVFVVLSSPIEETSLLRYASHTLPAYMLPDDCIILDTIPTNINGKVDRSALRSFKLTPTKRIQFEPKSEIEREVYKIWKDVLGRNDIGTTDSFFELGGNSIDAIKVLHRINIEFALSLTINQIFISQTITELSQIVETFHAVKDSNESKGVESFRV